MASLFVSADDAIPDTELIARVQQHFGDVQHCQITRRAPIPNGARIVNSIDQALQEALRQLPVPLDWELIRASPKSTNMYYLSHMTTALVIGDGPWQSTRELEVALLGRGDTLPRLELQFGPVRQRRVQDSINYDAEAHQLLLERAWGEAAEYKTLFETQQRKVAELQSQLEQLSQMPRNRQTSYCGRRDQTEREPNPYHSGSNSSRSSEHIRSLASNSSSISPSPSEHLEHNNASAGSTTKQPTRHLNLEERIRLAQDEAKRIVEQTKAQHLNVARSKYQLDRCAKS